MNKRERDRLAKKSYEELEKKSNEEFRAGLEKIKEAKRRRTDLKYLVLLGEKAPRVDADTLHDALVSALRFAHAYRLDTPVQVGETSLLDLERRIFYESRRTKQPWLVHADSTLSEKIMDDENDQPFDAVWIPLEGSNLPISEEQLSAAIAEIRGEPQAVAEPYVLVPRPDKTVTPAETQCTPTKH